MHYRLNKISSISPREFLCLLLGPWTAHLIQLLPPEILSPPAQALICQRMLMTAVLSFWFWLFFKRSPGWPHLLVATLFILLSGCDQPSTTTQRMLMILAAANVICLIRLSFRLFHSALPAALILVSDLFLHLYAPLMGYRQLPFSLCGLGEAISLHDTFLSTLLILAPLCGESYLLLRERVASRHTLRTIASKFSDRITG